MSVGREASSGRSRLDEHEAVYIISVAADLAGMHPQTLRQYDRLGLVSPRRTAGRGRRYSPRDVSRLREVQRLSQDEGVNLAGIKQILELQERLRGLQEELEAAERAAAARSAAAARVFWADSAGQISAGSRERRPRRPGGALVRWRPLSG